MEHERSRRMPMGCRYAFVIVTLISVLSCYSTKPKETLLPPTFAEVQPGDVPIPQAFRLVDEPGAAYQYQRGSFRWASARYRGDLSVENTAARMRESMGIHGWTLSGEEGLPSGLPGARLEFDRGQQQAIVQVFIEGDSTILQVDIRTTPH